MDTEQLRELLTAVASRGVSVDSALAALERLPFEDLGYARVDHHRALRQGHAEVVFGEGKTPAQIAGITAKLIAAGQGALVTRVDAAKAEAVQRLEPALRYEATARALVAPSPRHVERGLAPVAVVTAGTSDIPVAEEACVTLTHHHYDVDRVYDVGVAGLQRLLAALPRLRSAPALIVIAGMEGALASVVGGLVSAPVVAVPTSVGYGTALGGLTPLFGMLTACSSGLTVVNIDNGFGAALAVTRMLEGRGRSAEASP